MLIIPFKRHETSYALLNLHSHLHPGPTPNGFIDYLLIVPGHNPKIVCSYHHIDLACTWYWMSSKTSDSSTNIYKTMQPWSAS